MPSGFLIYVMSAGGIGMKQSIMIALDVFIIGFIISFLIAVLIKALMFFIRYAFKRNEKKTQKF